MSSEIKKSGGAAATSKGADKQMISVADAIARATQFYQNGRFPAAEKLCREIIASRPNNSDAHNILGVTLFRVGKAEEGLEKVRRAAALDPSNPNYFSNLGEMERKAKNLDAAEAALVRAVALDPQSAQAHNNLGIVHFDKREFDKAAESYRTAIALKEDYAEAHNNLGNAMRALDDINGAVQEYERAIELRENYAEAYNNMATALRDLQRTEEAEYSYRRAVEIKPDYLEALNNLANMLIVEKRYEDALRTLGDTLRTHPRDVGTLVTTARAQMSRGNTQLAERAVGLALEVDPKSVEALCLKGQLYNDMDRWDDAVKAYEAALAINPESIEALNMYGVTLKSLGRMDEARDAFMKALELQPRSIGAYSNIIDLENFTKDNPLFQGMLDMLEAAKDKEHERFMSLHFALGKAYDDAKDYETALKHFSIGAGIKRSQLKYDEKDAFEFFDEIRETFDEDYFKNLPYEGNPTTLPVFIVGMPRSGSTLTEQIIASHPQVFGAGEIKNLSAAMGAIRSRFPNIPRFPQMAKTMKPTQFAMIAEHYLKSISNLSPTATRVTDKLLTNYYFVGMLATIYPNAKVIHTMRNPVDTCLSSYTKLYKDDMPHSYDLRELGRYYSKYSQLMAHWRRVLPKGFMLETQYEDVVADKETKAREIIAFLGLPWDDRCLNFHETDRPVKTASVSQVRKPMYNTSVERWRRYGDGLKPLIEALEAGVPE
ncbi:MAG TPA: tetratricopeptide repeat protein [Rhizomicrobium sp.]|nr:tetratricopeptide repeat protein [Rhizomicrobium sp.]